MVLVAEWQKAFMKIFYLINIVTSFHNSQHLGEVCFEFLSAVLSFGISLVTQLEPDTI